MQLLALRVDLTSHQGTIAGLGTRVPRVHADTMPADAHLVDGESSELGNVYNALVEFLRAEVTISAREAWSRQPVRTGADMNIGLPQRPAVAADPFDGRMPAEWLIVQQFSSLIQYRIGWRRYFWIRPLLRRRLARLRIVEIAETAFAKRSARLLNLPGAPEGGVPERSA